MSQPQSGEAPSGERLRGKGRHWCNCKKHYVIHACGALALECEVLQKERYTNILLPALYLLMAFRMSKSISKPNFVEISIGG